MEQALVQYGISSGILALLILKEVFTFIKTRSNGKNGYNGSSRIVDYFRQIIDQLKLSNRQTYDLWEWHKPDQETKKFKWYGREDEIMRSFQKVGDDIVKEIRELRKDINRK